MTDISKPSAAEFFKGFIVDWNLRAMNLGFSGVPALLESLERDKRAQGEADLEPPT